MLRNLPSHKGYWLASYLLHYIPLKLHRHIPRIIPKGKIFMSSSSIFKPTQITTPTTLKTDIPSQKQQISTSMLVTGVKVPVSNFLPCGETNIFNNIFHILGSSIPSSKPTKTKQKPQNPKTPKPH